MSGLRERRRAELRRQVDAAALGLAARDGNDAVTTEEVAAAAGISLRTLLRQSRARTRSSGPRQAFSLL